ISCKPFSDWSSERGGRFLEILGHSLFSRYSLSGPSRLSAALLRGTSEDVFGYSVQGQGSAIVNFEGSWPGP
ncbi:MAG: hypothetical protein VX992_05550, partial [Acidobacteriota bacterium]|nr:hypothetical protein [Acidobacteriota bacterium]